MSESHKIYPQTLEECWKEIDELEALLEGMHRVTDADVATIEDLKAELADAKEEIKDLMIQNSNLVDELRDQLDEVRFNDTRDDGPW